MGQAAIPIAIGVVSVLTSAAAAYQSYDAKKDAANEIDRANEAADELAKINAEKIKTETAEDLRRARASKARERGLLKAKLGASGIRGTSPEAYMASFLSERDKEIDWIRQSGTAREAIARRGGGYNPRPQGPSGAQLASSLASTSAQGYEWYQRYV